MFDIVNANSESLQERIPYRMQIDSQGRLLFRWLYVGQQKYDRPFFDESIADCLSFPENSFEPMPVTTAEIVMAQAEIADSIDPAAFIFHVSRCGSTLISQMLCEEERFIVLAEVPLLDDLLKLHYSGKAIKESYSVEELYIAVLRLLGRRRKGNETHLFVKTDSWHLLFYERIQHMYPSVAKLLLYRTPQEVIYSHQKKSGIHSIPGILPPELFGFSSIQIEGLSKEAYFELILEIYYKRCTEIIQNDSLAVAINYQEGAMAMLAHLLRMTNISAEDINYTAMENRTKHHSKNPQSIFSEEQLKESVSESKAFELYTQLDDSVRRRLLADSASE